MQHTAWVQQRLVVYVPASERTSRQDPPCKEGAVSSPTLKFAATQSGGMLGLGPRASKWLAAGALVTVLGVLIKFVGWTWLLAGYSESTSPVPDEVVQNTAGNTVLRIGIALLMVGALAAMATLPTYVDLIISGAILLAVARLIYRLNTWSPRQAS